MHHFNTVEAKNNINYLKYTHGYASKCMESIKSWFSAVLTKKRTC